MYIPATARGNGLVKPAGQLRLNRNHPAAYGLKHLFMCDGTGMTDLVTGKRYKATGGSQAVDAFGVGWKSGGAGTCIVGPTGAEANKTGNADNGVSVIVSGKFSNSTSTAAIANSYYADLGGWVFKAAQYSNTNQVGFGSFGVGDDYVSGIATPTAEGSVISVRAVAGTTQYRVKNSTSSTANATPSNVGDYISIGAGFKFNSATPRDTLNSGDIVYWAAIFDETISAAQADAWHRGPFGSIVTRVLITDIWWVGEAASTDPALTGQTGTFTVGAVTPSLSLSISGQTATLTAGAVTPNLSLALVGQSATFSAGAVTPSIDKGITGQTATFSSGALSPELTVALSGQTATFTSGSVTASTSSAIVLDGQTATFSSGVLTPEISIALTGQTATFTSGSLASSTDGNVSLMGQTGTFTAGTLSPELALGITGQAATFTAGNVLASLDIGIVGQTATFTQGALTPSLTVELTGQTATFTAGQVGAPSGDLTVALMGQTATFTAGALSVPSTATEGGGGYLYWRKSRKEWEDERKKLKVTPKEITRVAQKVARSVIADTGMADPVETLKDNRAQYAQMAMNELRGFWSPSVQDAITRQIQIAVTLKKRQQQDDEELMLLL